MASEKAALWADASSDARERFIQAIVERVIIHPDEVEVSIRRDALLQQLAGKATAPAESSRETFSLKCSFRYVPRGKAIRLIVGEMEASPDACTLAVLKAIARARTWRDQIITGEASGIRDLARIHGLNCSYVKKIYPFAALSPASIELIINQRCKTNLTLDDLCSQVSIDWREQVKVFS